MQGNETRFWPSPLKQKEITPNRLCGEVNQWRGMHCRHPQSPSLLSKGSQIRTLGIQVEDGSFPTSSEINWPLQEGEYKNLLWSFEVAEFL